MHLIAKKKKINPFTLTQASRYRKLKNNAHSLTSMHSSFTHVVNIFLLVSRALSTISVIKVKDSTTNKNFDV